MYNFITYLNKNHCLEVGQLSAISTNYITYLVRLPTVGTTQFNKSSILFIYIVYRASVPKKLYLTFQDVSYSANIIVSCKPNSIDHFQYSCVPYLQHRLPH